MVLEWDVQHAHIGVTISVLTCYSWVYTLPVQDSCSFSHSYHILGRDIFRENSLQTSSSHIFDTSVVAGNINVLLVLWVSSRRLPLAVGLHTSTVTSAFSCELDVWRTYITCLLCKHFCNPPSNFLLSSLKIENHSIAQTDVIIYCIILFQFFSYETTWCLHCVKYSNFYGFITSN